MGGEWQKVKLGDIAENASRPFDFSNRERVVFINTGDVLHGKFLHSNRIVPKGLPGQAKKRIEKNDILFSEIRPANGRYALVDFDPEDHVVSTKFMVIRRLSEEIDPQFFYIQLTCDQTLCEFQRIAESRSGTFPQITFDSVAYYPFILPPLPEQRAIAHILGSLDDKIELNRRMNQTLEATARAIFKSWFVDFDPVCAKAEGATSLSGMPQDVFDQLPDRLIGSDLGPIPEGWEIKTLGDLVKELKNRVTPSVETQSLPYVPIDCITSKSICLENNKSGKEAKSSLVRFNEDNILFGAMRPYFHKVCLAPFSGTTRTTAFVLKPRLNDDLSFVLLLLSESSTIDFATQHSVGSTIPYAKWDKSLASMPIVSAEESIRGIFHSIVWPSLSLLKRSYFENRTLASLRDTLLPKLISGELRVPDAEKFAREAGV